MKYEITFEDQFDYENRLNIEIELRSEIAVEDQKTVLDAVEVLKKTLHPYLEIKRDRYMAATAKSEEEKKEAK